MATNINTKTRKKVPVQYKRPLSLSPWGKSNESGRDGSVWISMKPIKILDQYSKGAGTFGTEDINTEFLFLAPLNLSENIIHHWESYESVASRLAQKARSLVKLGAEGTAIYNIGKNFLTGDKTQTKAAKGVTKGSTIEQFAVKAYNLVPGSKIPNIKVNTPLYYANSERRQLSLEFQLFNEHVAGYNTEDILIKPIQEMMKYSSPNLIGDIQIDFPYMWKIKTLPEGFINYPTTVLTAVQPVWNSPYINGYPSSCNLTLTFTDLSPLFAETIEKGTIVNVVNKSSVTQRIVRSQKATQNATRALNKIGNPKLVQTSRITRPGV